MHTRAAELNAGIALPGAFLFEVQLVGSWAAVYRRSAPLQRSANASTLHGLHRCHPARARIILLLGDRLGVRVTNERLDCVIDPALLAHYQGQWAALPYPRVTVLRRASRWTPNKDWPDANWTDLIGRLSRRATVIEIGEAAAAAAEHRYPKSSTCAAVRQLTSSPRLSPPLTFMLDRYRGRCISPPQLPDAPSSSMAVTKTLRIPHIKGTSRFTRRCPAPRAGCAIHARTNSRRTSRVYFGRHRGGRGLGFWQKPPSAGQA